MRDDDDISLKVTCWQLLHGEYNAISTANVPISEVRVNRANDAVVGACSSTTSYRLHEII